MGKTFIIKLQLPIFFKITIKYFNELTDEREEWEKDLWDVRNLEQYGITYNKSCHEHNLDFEKINNLEIRKEVKKYMKQRLIANNKFSWASACK